MGDGFPLSGAILLLTCRHPVNNNQPLGFLPNLDGLGSSNPTSDMSLMGGYFSVCGRDSDF